MLLVWLASSEQGRLDGELQQPRKEFSDLEVLKEENDRLALEVESRSTQSVALEEKHRADTKELIELGFRRFRDCYKQIKQIIDLNFGVPLRLVEVSSLL